MIIVSALSLWKWERELYNSRKYPLKSYRDFSCSDINSNSGGLLDVAWMGGGDDCALTFRSHFQEVHNELGYMSRIQEHFSTIVGTINPPPKGQVKILCFNYLYEGYYNTNFSLDENNFVWFIFICLSLWTTFHIFLLNRGLSPILDFYLLALNFIVTCLLLKLSYSGTGNPIAANFFQYCCQIFFLFKYFREILCLLKLITEQVLWDRPQRSYNFTQGQYQF